MSAQNTIGTCAVCQKPATTRCSGCHEAPSYDDDQTTVSTFYCTPLCQKADWGRHKSDCRKLQVRKKVDRGTRLLQAIFYKIRMHASSTRFDFIHTEGSKVFLEGFQVNLMATQQLLGPFQMPLEGDRDQSILEAVLAYAGCMEAMMYLHSFTGALLAGICLKIEEVNIRITKPKLQIIPLLANGISMDIQHGFHNAYRVTLRTGEIWAVDPTGAQFGYTNPLCPWHDFMRHRVDKINLVHELGYVRRTSYQDYGTFPLRPMVIQKVEKQALNKMLEDKIPVLAQEHASKLSNKLKGSDATFEKTKDRFLEQLEDCVRVSMMKLYSVEQIRRTTKEVDDQMAQNEVDPNGQNRLTDFLTKFMPSSSSDYEIHDFSN